MTCRLAILLSFAVVAALGQARPGAWPIGKLEVEGNKIYADEKILTVAGLKVGDVAGKKEFDAAQQRLLATGAFESVGYRFDPIPGARANLGTFKVDEITQLFPYRFEELHVDEKALRAHLKAKETLFGDEVPATQPILDRMAKDIQAFAKRPDEVVARLESGNPELIIVFRPASLPSVASITFRGNIEIPRQRLQQAIANAGIGSVYTENRFRQILDASIRPLYEAKGHMRVKFPKIEVAHDQNVSGVAVTVNVEEGPVYKLSEVELQGELAENKELIKTGNFQTGQEVNFDEIRSGVDEIKKAFRRKGFIETDITTDRKFDDEKKTMTLVLKVDPGPKFTMGKLTIEGLDIQTEPHIRKLWVMNKGDAFNVEYPDYFLSRLVEDEVMDNLGRTRSVSTPDPGTQTVDVTLILEPGKPKPEKPQAP